MPQSMTGYGRCTLAQDGREVTIELKSVNHRFLDLAFRMPRSFAFLENDMRAHISNTLARGHVDIFVTYKNSRDDARKVTLDSALLGEYLTTLRQGGIDHMLDDNLRLRDVLSMQDVLTVEEADEDQQALSALTLSALDTALDSLCAMRRREGEAMRGDVETRLDTLERTAHAIDERAPQWLEEYRQRLRARIEEICQMQLDEARLTGSRAGRGQGRRGRKPCACAAILRRCAIC